MWELLGGTHRKASWAQAGKPAFHKKSIGGEADAFLILIVGAIITLREFLPQRELICQA